MIKETVKSYIGETWQCCDTLFFFAIEVIGGEKMDTNILVDSGLVDSELSYLMTISYSDIDMFKQKITDLMKLRI